MTNPKVEARWTATLEAVKAAVVGATQVFVRVPGWQPADLATGLHWLRMQIYEGFQVGYLVERDGDDAILWMKAWEDGWDGGEPEWDAVKLVPIADPRPDQTIW